MRILLYILILLSIDDLRGQDLKNNSSDTSFKEIFIAGQNVKTKQILQDTNYVILFENKKNPVGLNSDELLEIKKIISNCIKESKYLLDISKYKRQYSPYIDKEGDKMIYVYCHCSYHKDWRKKPIEVIDGGKCYFKVKINLRTKKYSDLQIESDG